MAMDTKTFLDLAKGPVAMRHSIHEHELDTCLPLKQPSAIFEDSSS